MFEMEPKPFGLEPFASRAYLLAPDVLRLRATDTVGVGHRRNIAWDSILQLTTSLSGYETKILALYAAREPESSISTRSTARKKEACLINSRVYGEKGRNFSNTITLVRIKISIHLETASRFGLCRAAHSHMAAFRSRPHQ